MPKSSRSKKKKILYGSDIDDLDEGGFTDYPAEDLSPIALAPANNLPAADSAEFPIERRQSARTPRILQVEEEEDEDGHVYDPSLERQSRHRRREMRNTRRSRDTGGHESFSSSQQATAESPDWLSISDRRYSPYLPQIYDMVAYFPEGHRTFLAKEARPQFHEHLQPYVSTAAGNRRSQQSPVIAQVVDIQFFVLPDRPWCQLTLIPLDDSILLSDEQQQQALRSDFASPDRFVIKYYDMEDIPDFLILASRYQWSLGQDYHVGHLVRVLYGHDEIYSGRITRAGSRRRSSWQCYTIEWLTLTDPPEDCSPWELEPVDDTGSAFQPYSCHESIPEPILRLLSDGLHSITQSRRAHPFIAPVDYRAYPDYLLAIAHPMYLELIQRRLQNGFYRRLESFFMDVQLIATNSLVYNEPESGIVRDAEHMLQLFEALYRRVTRPSRHSGIPVTHPSLLASPMLPIRNSIQSLPTSPPPQEDVGRSSRKRIRIIEPSGSEDDEDEPPKQSLTGRRPFSRLRHSQEDRHPLPFSTTDAEASNSDRRRSSRARS